MALIKKFVLRLWNSPTITSWALKGATSVRILLVLPLTLKTFNDVEIASWFLFSTLLFFSSMVFDQASMIFSRMIALALGGAEDLRPIKPGEPPRGSGSPNWDTIRKLYETIGGLNVLVSGIGVLISLAMGYFSFTKLLEGYEAAHEIWTAFAVFLAGDFVHQVFRKYAISLRGLNQVALTARWSAVFSLISSAAAAAALLMGVGIIGLAVVVQSFQVITVLRLRYFLFYRVEPRFRSFSPYTVHKEIIAFLFTPLLKALTQSYASRGCLKIGVIFLTRHSSPADLASMLLLIKLLETLKGFAIAPISTHVPKFARLLAKGEHQKLSTGVIRSTVLAQKILALGFCLILFVAPYALKLIGTNTRLPNMSLAAFTTLSYYLVSVSNYSLLINVIGNNYILIKRMIFSTLLTLLSGTLMIQNFGMYGFVWIAFWPFIVLLNFQPILYAAKTAKINPMTFFSRSYGYSFFAIVLMTLALIIFK